MEKENKQRKPELSFTVKNIVIAGIFSYIAAIFTLPTMGLFAKLPMAFVFSCAASLICTSKKWIISMMAVMPLVLNLLYGAQLKTALVSAIVFAVAGWFGILARRAFFTILASKRQNNKDNYVKSIVVLVVSILVGVLLQVIIL